MNNQYRIRWMIRVDLPRVLEIEAANYACPWEEADFLESLRKNNQIGMVVENSQDRVDAFMIYEPQKRVLRLIKIVVHPDHQRKGLGKLMIEKLKSKLRPDHRDKLRVVVDETDLETLNFFKALGLRAKRVKWASRIEEPDQIVMVYHVSSDCPV